MHDGKMYDGRLLGGRWKEKKPQDRRRLVVRKKVVGQ
jgi:hypothetical protein